MVEQKIATDSASPSPPDIPKKEKNPLEDVYARRVVVPVSNPQTAPQLIRFAASLVHPEKGKVKALYVNLPDSPYKDARENIERVAQVAKSQNMPVELVSVNAPTVQRAVLDVIREQNADLLVLGFQAPKLGQIVFGPITEAVARVTASDLIVFRHFPNHEPKRIIVPITDLEDSKIALMHALHISEAYGDIPIIALYVKTETPTPFWRIDIPPPAWQQLSMMEMALADIPQRSKIQSKFVQAVDLVTGAVQEATMDDLLMLSVQRLRKNQSGKWLFGPTAQKILRLAPGSVALIKRYIDEDETRLQRINRRILRWTPTLTLDERQEVVESVDTLMRANTNFVVMMILSTILASIGLLQNSGAVVIGAMLVAPLMSPLMGFGIGLAIGDTKTLRRSAITVTFGVVMVLAVASIIGVIASFPLPTSEMLARGEPTLLDMLVALASGMAGAFALARRDVPAALAGVAIAAALVPPICTTGLALALGDMDLMIGAGTLSIVNIVCISLASAGTLAIMGVRGKGGVPILSRTLVSVVILLALAVPMGWLFYSANQRNRLTYETENIIEARFPDAQVMEIDIKGKDVTATFRTSRSVSFAEMKATELAIEEKLDKDITLHLVVLRLIESEAPEN